MLLLILGATAGDDAFGRTEGVAQHLADAGAGTTSAPAPWQHPGATDEMPRAFPPADRCSGTAPVLAKDELTSFVYKRLGGNPVSAEPVKLVRCQAPDPAAGRGAHWSIQRVGPFEIQGGGDDMHIFNWGGVGSGWLDKSMDLAPEEGGDKESAGMARFITGTFIGVVDDDGKPLGNPPAHLHHVHVGWVHHDHDKYERRAAGLASRQNRIGVGAEGFWEGDWFEQRHGDSQCLAEDGGTACLGHAYPNGTGIRVRREYEHPESTPGVEHITSEVFQAGLYTDGMVNDGRPKAAAALPVRFWFEVAIRWTAVQQRPIGLRNMGSPYCVSESVGAGGEKDGDFAAWVAEAQASSSETRYPEALSNAGLFYVPEDSPSVLWYTFKVTDNLGKYLWTTFHAHARWFRSAMLFTGVSSPVELGLCGGAERSGWAGAGAEHRGCWIALPAPNIPARLHFDDEADAARLSVAQFERRLAAALARKRGRKVCQFNRTLETVDGHTYDRRSRGGCDPSWVLAKGQVVTVVALYEPSGDMRRQQHEVKKLRTGGNTQDERSAMAFKIGKRGVPEHAIFRGLYKDADPTADVLPGFGVWGGPQPNKCYVTATEEAAERVGGKKMKKKTATTTTTKKKNNPPQELCWSCVQGACLVCKSCLKTVNGKQVGMDGGHCAPCWLGMACLHDTAMDCRMCWGFPPKKGKVIDEILARLHISRDDFKG
jgi:hypothetical protein